MQNHKGDITAVISIIARLMLERGSGYESIASILAHAACRMIVEAIGMTFESPAVEAIKKRTLRESLKP